MKGNIIIENIKPIGNTSKISVKNIVLIGMCTTILIIISQISLPTPTGVPLTIQCFGIALIGVILGSKLGLYTIICYIFLGAAGLPVFSNFHGGVNWIFGITGGYILAWPVMVIACGLKFKNKQRIINIILTTLFSIIGLLFVELIGCLQWSILSGNMNFHSILIYSIFTFIPKDIIVTILGVIVGFNIRKPLLKLGLLE